MLASSWMDPVLGVDIHIVAVPSPAGPVPTPLPHPFIGMVFDPMGAVVGAAISTALGAGPTMTLVNSMPATNCGTEVMATPPHIPMPPGVAHPKPPDNDAELMFGGMQGGVEGSFGVRLGDIALSCGDPVRMPTSTVLAVPKGPPVMNMKPMAPDLATIAMAGAMKAGMKGLGAAGRGLRGLQRSSKSWKRASDAIKNKLDAVTPQRMRGLRDRAVCFVTGHPVDVATGRMFTEVTDLELPGPLPLEFARAYDTSFSWRDGPMGRGWSHTFESSLWLEPGKVVLKAEDGRELEFSTLDFKDRVMRDGQSLFDPVYRMTLKCTGPMRFEVQEISGVVHKYEPVPGGDPNVAQRAQKRDRSGFHLIEYHYDKQGRVEWVRDCGGRLVGLEYDKNGRLSALKVPLAKGHGHRIHRRFFYGKDGDLERVEDSLGHSWTFDYVDHLMVQETDRTGLSFYFQYDRFGAGAKCVRTWGDGGIYDHVISYTPDNKKTIVEDSLGAVTIYEMDDKMQVIGVTDAMGATTTLEYDPTTGLTTTERDALGRETRREYDDRGNLLSRTEPGELTAQFDYDTRFDLPTRFADALGRVWQWTYDRHGRLVSLREPTGDGTQYEWGESGLLTGVSFPGERRLGFQHDDRKNLALVSWANGVDFTFGRDGLGRLTRRTAGQRGPAQYFDYDTEGRLVRERSLAGVATERRYDREGNLIEGSESGRRVAFSYAGRHRVASRSEGGQSVRYLYDTEDRIVGMKNEAGELFAIHRNLAGDVSMEVGFDGSKRIYQRDQIGRVTTIRTGSGRTTSLTYGEAGRLERAENSDGSSTEFQYDPVGQVIRATNESADVLFERDALGRIVAESQDGGDHWIRSDFSPTGERKLLRTDYGLHQEAELGPMGELLAIRHAAGGDRHLSQLSFERDSVGLEVARELPGGVRITWERDAAGRPLQRRLDAPNQAPRAQLYEWRGEDQISSIRSGSQMRLFDHDATGRLTREHRPDRSETFERKFDETGNVYVGLGDAAYSTGGRLQKVNGTRFAYDEDGNRTEKIMSDGDRWGYEWNDSGMLTSVERPDGARISFAYDAFARRVLKRVVSPSEAGEPETVSTTRFVWDQHNLVHQLDDSGSTTTWFWTPGSDCPAAQDRDGQYRSIASDQVGAPTEMYDELGNLVWEMQLDVLGVPRFERGEARDCPWRWPGQYEDVETGDHYNRWRYWDRDTNVYLSSDPLAPFISLRPYAYVDDPLWEADPKGLHVVKAWMRESETAPRRPVNNPQTGNNRWPNQRGSGGNDMAPSGLGRAGDSENLLMESLSGRDPESLRGAVIEIESVPSSGGSSLPPCDFCDEGMQRFSDKTGATVVYTQTGRRGMPVGEPRVYRPGGCK